MSPTPLLLFFQVCLIGKNIKLERVEGHTKAVEYNVGKRGIGGNIIFSFIFRLFGRISSGGERGRGIKWGWGRISC